jgi:hypothetical protein
MLGSQAIKISSSIDTTDLGAGLVTSQRSMPAFSPPVQLLLYRWHLREQAGLCPVEDLVGSDRWIVGSDMLGFYTSFVAILLSNAQLPEAFVSPSTVVIRRFDQRWFMLRPPHRDDPRDSTAIVAAVGGMW